MESQHGSAEAISGRLATLGSPVGPMAGTSPLFRQVIQRDFVSELEELGIVFPEEIGSGTFSAVFHAWLLPNLEDPIQRFEPHEVAVKLVWDDVTERRLLKEAQMLHRLAGMRHCADLVAVRRLSMGSVLITPYLEADAFETLSCGPSPTSDAGDGGLNAAGQAACSLGWAGIAVYARRLLEALAHTHSRGIIHRDVKPRNFLFQARTGRAFLIDYGLAQSTEEQLHKADRTRQLELRAASRLYVNVAERVLADGVDQHTMQAAASISAIPATPGAVTGPRSAPSSSSSSVRVVTGRAARVSSQAVADASTVGLARRKPRADRAGTPGFRPPEVLLTVAEQGPGVDVWAAGVVLATVVSQRCPLLPGKEDGMQLAMIAALVGPERVARAAERLGRAIVVAPLGGVEAPMMAAAKGSASRAPGDRTHSSSSVRDEEWSPSSVRGSMHPQSRVAGALPLARGRMLLSEAGRDAVADAPLVIPPLAAIYGDSDTVSPARCASSRASCASSASAATAAASANSASPLSRQHQAPDDVAVPAGATLEAVDAALAMSWLLPLASALPNTAGADRTRLARLIPRSRVRGEADHAIALQCVDFLACLLDPDPLTRVSAAAALSHPFLSPRGALASPSSPGVPAAVVEQVRQEAEPAVTAALEARVAAVTAASKLLETMESEYQRKRVSDFT